MAEPVHGMDRVKRQAHRNWLVESTDRRKGDPSGKNQQQV
jgi:hypothetical protein